MLKKMRRRVILSAILAFFSVIMLIAVLVNVVNYVVQTNNADRTIEAIRIFEEINPLEFGAGGPPEGNIPPDSIPDGEPMPDMPAQNPDIRPFTGLPNVEANYMTRFFVVRLSADGTVSSTSRDYIASVDEEEAKNYASKVLKKKRTADI